ncbi:hypothetical protein EWM64_g5743 [Hericium alpestre]|uniref:Uncharacterized protein n=1 Tax=Hericium alpestre TaxID=135208 RepID=A0A4Y9ZXS0_9AGAM|nr:hypothetical protein EWM64_g5743 [Hericium alpestre]
MQQNALVERALERLLEEPFGPYLDKDILSARCKSTKTSILQLQQVMFEREGQAVGVNENDDIRFRGILALSSFNHLSPAGVEYITSEIRHRFTEMQNAGTPLRHLRDSTSVADVFRELDNWRKRREVSNKKQDQDVPTVNVWVQGEKEMAVGYLTSEFIHPLCPIDLKMKCN